MKEIAKYIDHTLLSADGSAERVKQLCKEALDYNFASVCINSCYVSLCAELLKGSFVKVCSVVGFPLGAMVCEAKAFEAKVAVEQGADEIDMVINIGFLKDKRDKEVEEEIRRVREACADKTLKVIIEAALLTQEEKIRACEIAVRAKADFVKTSTGFSTYGATVEDVELMRKTVGSEVGVKAAGGIRSYEQAVAMIKAGANRIGASSSIAIVKGSVGNEEY
ncbi:MAG: deoxyribose-phosphate aldolase [Sphaerochaetaceae bacterium]